MSQQAQELEELNRRVAIEVMGEEEPANPERLTRPDPLYVHFRDINNAWMEHYGPEGREVLPKPFSYRMDLAMRAVDKVINHVVDEMITGYAVLSLDYWVDSGWLAEIEPENFKMRAEARGDTAPEAICRCLLSFVEGLE